MDGVRKKREALGITLPDPSKSPPSRLPSAKSSVRPTKNDENINGVIGRPRLVRSRLPSTPGKKEEVSARPHLARLTSPPSKEKPLEKEVGLGGMNSFSFKRTPSTRLDENPVKSQKFASGVDESSVETPANVGRGAWGLSPTAQEEVHSGNRQRNMSAFAVAKAEARVVESVRRRKFSRGDKDAYQGLRVPLLGESENGQKNETNTSYYALTKIGASQILMHGGQADSGAALNPSKAVATTTIFSMSREGRDLTMKPASYPLPALVGHSIVCFKGHYLIIYGGCGKVKPNVFSDVISINFKTGNCTRLKKAPPQPPGRARHASCIFNDQMIIHGGYDNSSGAKLLDDMWALDIVEAKWEKLRTDLVNETSLEDITRERKIDSIRGPCRRYGHHLAAYGDSVYLAFGGDEHEGLSDIWQYYMAGKYWNLVSPKGVEPSSRLDAAAAVFGTEKWLFHGGISAKDGTLINTFYEFNFRTHEGRQMRVELDESPAKIIPALRGHRMVTLDVNGEKTGSTRPELLIFGGVNRVGSIAAVTYAVFDTGKSPGSYINEPAVFPEFSLVSGAALFPFKIPSSSATDMEISGPSSSYLDEAVEEINEDSTSTPKKSVDQDKTPEANSLLTALGPGPAVKSSVFPDHVASADEHVEKYHARIARLETENRDLISRVGCLERKMKTVNLMAQQLVKFSDGLGMMSAALLQEKNVLVEFLEADT